MNLFDWLIPKPYVHPLAVEREELADRLDGWSVERRHDILEEVAKTNPALYESWMLEPYPGRGDR